MKGTYSHYEKLFGMAQHDTANLETAVKLYDDTFQVVHFVISAISAWARLRETNQIDLDLSRGWF